MHPVPIHFSLPLVKFTQGMWKRFKTQGVKLTDYSAMDAADAKALTIPHIVLASKDEPAVVIGEYADVITNGKGGLVETYPSMVSFQRPKTH